MTTAAHRTADQIVEVEVRELVRRRGLDPGNGDASAVRQLIDEVVADYAERRLVANMPGRSWLTTTRTRLAGTPRSRRSW